MLTYFIRLVCLLQLAYIVQAVDPTLTVGSCSRQETTFTVLNGVVGGIVYVETTTSDGCIFTITSSINTTVNVNFTACGVQYVQRDFNLTLEFIVVTQADKAYNAFTDSRFLTACKFTVGDSYTADFIDTGVLDPDGTANGNGGIVEHVIVPRPQLVFYMVNTSDDGTQQLTQTSTGDRVELGQPMVMEINIAQPIPDLELVVQFCFVNASVKNVEVSSMHLTDIRTLCVSNPNLFSEFSYYKDGGVYPYARSNFTAFLPTSPHVSLRFADLSLRFSCLVKVCLSSLNTCTHPTCPVDANSRRRRAAADIYNNQTTGEFRLVDSFTVSLDTSKSTNTQPGTNTVCLEQAEFWSIIVSLLVLVVLASVCVCVIFCFRFRKYHDNLDHHKRKIMIETPPSTMTSSLRSLTGTSATKNAWSLPRFVQWNNNSVSA